MKKLLSYTLVASVLLVNSFMLLEGGVASADVATSTGADVSLGWDVTFDVTTELSLDCDVSDVNLGTISGFTGGEGTGTRPCTVKTNNQAGWEVAIATTRATGAAMVDDLTAETFADYAEAVAGTPETWTSGPNDSYFGFYATSTYGVAGKDVDLYQGFTQMTGILVAEDSSQTAVGGETITFGFKAVAGANAMQPTGSYVAPVSVTAHCK